MAIGNVYDAYPNGRPSGLPTDIVEQLVQYRASQVMSPIEDNISQAQDQKDIYSSLNSSLTDVYKAAKDMNQGSLFTAKAASSSNPNVASVTAEASASEGSYALEVSQLAQAHTRIVKGASAVSDPDDASNITNGVTLSFEHQGTSFSLLTNEDTTLSGIAQAVNETEDLGVTATVINTGTEESPNHMLKLKSDSTGAGPNLITTDGTSPGVALDGDLFTGGHAQEEAMSGLNAQFTIDGVSYERTSNQVSDAITGVSLNLLSDSEGPASLNVSLNTSAIAQGVESFVKSFNAFDSFLDQNAGYNEDTGKGGPLLGDTLARSAQNRIRSLVSEPVSGTGESSFQYLSEVGIELQEDGTLSLDTSTLLSALEEDTQAVSDLFTGEDGVAGKMESYLRDMTNPFDGVVSSKISSLDTKIDRLNEDLEDKEQYILRYEERQIEIFSRMESTVLKYQGVSDQLESIIDTWDTGGE